MLLWTQRLFVTSMFFRWWIEIMLVPRKETFLYTPSCYSKLITTSPRATHPYLTRTVFYRPCIRFQLQSVSYQPNRAKALSVCSKLDHSAIQVLRSFPEDECTCMRYILKPSKGTQPFKYMIAQFPSNMELTLVGESNGLHKHRTKLA